MTDSGELTKTLNSIHSFMDEYETKFGLGVPFRIIAAKYGKRLKRSGMELRPALESDPRFFVKLSRTGAYSVSLSSGAMINEMVVEVLRKHKGSVSIAALRHEINRLGGSSDDLDETLKYMESVSIVKTVVQAQGPSVVYLTDYEL